MNKQHSSVKFKCLITSILQLIWLPCFIHITEIKGTSQTAGSNKILERQVIVDLKETSVKDALLYVSGKAKVKIGFIETMKKEERGKKITVQILRGTVRNILDEIIIQDNSYKWEITNNIINVIPSCYPNEIANLKIGFLELTNKRLDEVGTAILDVPEVQIGIANLGKQQTDEVKYSGPPRRTPVSIVLSNITVRDGLNEILNKGFAGFWALEMRGEESEFVRIMLYSA